MPLSLVRQKERRPRQDRDGDIDEREQRDDVVDAAEVQQDAEADRDQLGARKPRRQPGRAMAELMSGLASACGPQMRTPR